MYVALALGYWHTTSIPLAPNSYSGARQTSHSEGETPPEADACAVKIAVTRGRVTKSEESRRGMDFEALRGSSTPGLRSPEIRGRIICQVENEK